jgi:hypothetical protein
MSEAIERQEFIGYRWESLLLPPGTRLRITYKGITFHAAVEGNDFICAGRRLTPSQFMNAYAGGRRDLWIKRPQDRDFRRADDLAATASEWSAWATLPSEHSRRFHRSQSDFKSATASSPHQAGMVAADSSSTSSTLAPANKLVHH